MFGIIVGTHGAFATGVLQSLEMIFGKRDGVKAVTLMPGEGPDDVVAKYEKTIKELGNPDRVLFLNDLLGGSPYNAACRIVATHENYGIVTGVNLPMLIQDMDDGSKSIADLMEQASEAGKNGISISSYESLNSSSDDDDL